MCSEWAVSIRQACGAIGFDRSTFHYQSLSYALEPFRRELRDALSETLTRAGTQPREITTVILVGGSSLMQMVAAEASALCPAADVHRADAFTAVVDGLALATGL